MRFARQTNEMSESPFLWLESAFAPILVMLNWGDRRYHGDCQHLTPGLQTAIPTCKRVPVIPVNPSRCIHDVDSEKRGSPEGISQLRYFWFCLIQLLVTLSLYVAQKTKPYQLRLSHCATMKARPGEVLDCHKSAQWPNWALFLFQLRYFWGSKYEPLGAACPLRLGTYFRTLNI